MRYVPMLDRALIVEASRQNRPLWGDGRSDEDHAAHTLAQLASAGPELLRYAGLLDGRGRLAGACKRFSLLLTEGEGEPVRAVGFGAVFTKPSMRGKGVASTLIRAVMEEARDLGYGAALLYSDIDPAYYARLGFVALPARDFSIATADLPVRGALATRPAREDDLDTLRALYEGAWPAGLLRPVRSRTIWRFFRKRNRVREHVIPLRGRAAGYVIAGPVDRARDLPAIHDERVFWFDEAAAPGVPRDRVWATVRALAEEAGATRVQGWIDPEGMPEGASRLGREESLPMIAPLSPGLRVRPRRAWLDSFMHF